MRTTIFTLTAFCLSIFGMQAQSTGDDQVLAEARVESTAPVQKSEYELKMEEKEAKKTVKVLKKRSKMERSALKLKTTQRTDGIKLEKLKTRHANSNAALSEVDREKLELKTAKLEMKMAKDKAKLEKLERKLLQF